MIAELAFWLAAAVPACATIAARFEGSFQSVSAMRSVFALSATTSPAAMPQTKSCDQRR